jgi:S-adenosylmethionine/arginine decarboxylase-like enzyme
MAHGQPYKFEIVVPEPTTDYWGLSCNIDIQGCDPATIRDENHIRNYVIDLCDLIDMKRFGDCVILHFGDDPRVEGYSMSQFIETSMISGHFSNCTNTAYLDIFSCKMYDPHLVADFTKQYFKGNTCTLQISYRK